MRTILLIFKCAFVLCVLSASSVAKAQSGSTRAIERDLRDQNREFSRQQRDQSSQQQMQFELNQLREQQQRPPVISPIAPSCAPGAAGC